MQTHISKEFKNSTMGREVDRILRSCVHCGFCTANCPTYQIFADELDGPRGRIYLIKQIFEGHPASNSTQIHLDRCLTCRSCETTCPSGVEYGRLIDIARYHLEPKIPRSWWDRCLRKSLAYLLPWPKRFYKYLLFGQVFRWLLPPPLRRKIPLIQRRKIRPSTNHSRRVILLDGCIQSATTPNTNISTERVLHKLGVSAVSPASVPCCGAVSYHLGDYHQAQAFMRANIDIWWHELNRGAEAIVMTASGCGCHVKDYAKIFANDPNYAEKAKTIVERTFDLSEYLAQQNLDPIEPMGRDQKVAFHAPCTLQHGQRITHTVESILQRCGYALTPIRDAHMCCGSAGTYSILHPKLAKNLLSQKLDALQEGAPECIATANIGCQLHLASQSKLPVYHWIELLDNDR